MDWHILGNYKYNEEKDHLGFLLPPEILLRKWDIFYFVNIKWSVIVRGQRCLHKKIDGP